MVYSTLVRSNIPEYSIFDLSKINFNQNFAQTAGNRISEVLVPKIFRGECPRAPLEMLQYGSIISIWLPK